MISVEITHNGKKHKDLISATIAVAANGLKEVIEKQVEPFRDEVQEGRYLNMLVYRGDQTR